MVSVQPVTQEAPGLVL